MNNTARKTAVDLRKRTTPAERQLWNYLRNRQLDGYKFLRQHPMVFEYDGGDRFFVADFCSHDARLVIEVDGGIHDDQIEYDCFRSIIINQLGYTVIRFTNWQVLERIQDVLTEIRERIAVL